NGFTSDDYFGLLDDDEGRDNLQGGLDISIGRLPVRNLAEAQIAVDKIISYDTDSRAMNDWINRITFVADDQDNNTHIRDADGIARDLQNDHERLNIDKIYFDAYQQVSTAGGEKYPAVTNAINANIFKGLLVMNYLGHGGWKGWSQERVMGINDIKSWTNKNALPLFVTATCSFSGYDDPTLTTGGEEVFLNERGGAIALFSTVRAVYASSNEALTSSVFRTIFEKEDGRFRTLGETLRVAKNRLGTSSSINTNSRKFTLLGDPAMRLALPEYNVQTTKINGLALDTMRSDTIRALQRVTIEGMVVDDDGQPVTDFNGKVYPTIYDKQVRLFTLGQDEDSSVRGFDLQKSVIFKGTASVVNGQFQFTFVVPRDINFEFGRGKISYYASDESSRDATGYYNEVVIGGTDDNALSDQIGPEIEVFMNDTTFAFGGLTNTDPILLVKLRDDNGINVVGNSIGHDLTAVLDGNTQNTLQLNDFYESALD
ncbi:MAG: type IX secretion system sortase PorU, partial [Bacteroidota bacterium]